MTLIERTSREALFSAALFTAFHSNPYLTPLALGGTFLAQIDRTTSKKYAFGATLINLADVSVLILSRRIDIKPLYKGGALLLWAGGRLFWERSKVQGENDHSNISFIAERVIHAALLCNLPRRFVPLAAIGVTLARKEHGKVNIGLPLLDAAAVATILWMPKDLFELGRKSLLALSGSWLLFTTIVTTKSLI